MIVRCSFKKADPLYGKNVALLYECKGVNRNFISIEDLRSFVIEIIDRLSRLLDIEIMSLSFMDNESIGSDYMIYRFRAFLNESSNVYFGIRIVTHRDKIVQVITTISREIVDSIDINKIKDLIKDSKAYRVRGSERFKEELFPPGQRYIPRFVIYKILGQPVININEWRLIVDGLVRNKLSFKYDDLLNMPMIKYKAPFHCVTGWSVSDVEWEGIQLRYLAGLAFIQDDVNWVYTTSVDGYTTVFPVEDFLGERSILAIRMNGETLSMEHGYPARIYIPHLYGWKGGKWLTRITFMDEYKEGYWEALGYHKRGNVYLEERYEED